MTPLEATRRAEAAASTRRSPLIWTLALGALLVAVAGVSVFGWLPTSEAVRGIVLREIRVPRVLAATVAGFALAVAGVLAVSYTHLDVYKRQGCMRSSRPPWASSRPS